MQEIGALHFPLFYMFAAPTNHQSGNFCVRESINQKNQKRKKIRFKCADPPPTQSKSVGFRFSPAFPAQSWNTKWKVLSWVSQKTSLGTKTKISFSFQHCPHTILKSVLAYNLNATKRNHTRWPKNAGFSSFWSIWSKHPLKHQLGHPPGHNF